ECRGSVCCRSLEQLVVAARGLRDRRAIRETSARDRGGRTHTFGVRRAGAKLKTRAVLPTQRHCPLARQTDSEEWERGTSLKSRRMNVTFSSSRHGNRHEHELS